MSVHKHTYETLSHHICSYIHFLLHSKEEGASVPVPVWDASDTIDAKLYLVGPVLLWHLSVLLPKQGEPGTAVGPAKGKSQDHDVPEDGTSAEKLFQNRWDSQGEKEAHLPVWWEDAERSTRRLQHSVDSMDESGQKQRNGMNERHVNGITWCPFCWF